MNLERRAAIWLEDNVNSEEFDILVVGGLLSLLVILSRSPSIVNTRKEIS